MSKCVTFYNVIVTVEAKDEKEAYLKLCQAFGSSEDIEYTTDTFKVYGEDEKKSTQLLMDYGPESE